MLHFPNRGVDLSNFVSTNFRVIRETKEVTVLPLKGMFFFQNYHSIYLHEDMLFQQLVQIKSKLLSGNSFKFTN